MHDDYDFADFIRELGFGKAKIDGNLYLKKNGCNTKIKITNNPDDALRQAIDWLKWCNAEPNRQ